MKNEFELAFNEVLEEKQLPQEVVLEALEAAMVSAYRRSMNASNAQLIEANIDSETGRVSIYAEKEVVEIVEDERTEVNLEDARKVDPESEVGGMVIVESTPKNFGRVAAQTARQVIQQRIREAERESQFEYFSKQVGEIVSGVVQAINFTGISVGLEMKAEGIMPRNHQMPRERFRVHDRIRALLLEVKTSPRGPQIILSRAHKNFLRRLLENEVPEIYHGLVEIRSISREPGYRSKVAVSALQPGVDPVGACVGIRGVRIQAIVRELNDEKIDVIEWNSDPAIYLAKALSPARVAGVYLNQLDKDAKIATVVVPEDQLSLAIGRDGQNARLAAKLTSWRIDIKSLPEAATDALYKLQNDPEFSEIAKLEVDNTNQVELILAKKAEGRPVTPEEYQSITQFVDRVERGILQKYQEEREAEEEQINEVKATIPDQAFSYPLEDFDVSDRVLSLISEGGYPTVGDLILQMKLDSDKILALHGMGPKGMSELEQAIEDLTFPEEEPVSEQVAETELEVEAVSIDSEEEITELVDEGDAAGIDEIIVEDKDIEKEPADEQETEAVEAMDDIDKLETPAEPEEEESLEELFAIQPEIFDYDQEEDDEISEMVTSEKKKKKKKKRYVQIEYDPDVDATIVKRKRKRSDQEWEEEW
jgi:N utilization substance protein A